MRHQQREKKWVIWGAFLLVTLISISIFDKHSKSSYLPEKLGNSTFIDEFDSGGLCGARLFALDEDVDDNIIKSGISYLQSGKSLGKGNKNNFYNSWRKTPIIEEDLIAMQGFYCARNSVKGRDVNLDKIGMVARESESDRSYYITTKNQEAAIFVSPRFSLFVYVYKDR
jgi:hypothetical protein